jgi:molecular chaperone GrpE
MSEPDEIVFEEEDGEGNTKSPAEKLKELREKLAEAKKERDQYLEGWQRAKADYVNAKKRGDEERQSLARFAAENLALSLLPVLDSFDHALESADGDEAWLEGIKNTHSQLMKALAQNGVEAFDPKGQAFDPLLHEPVETLAVSTPEEDNIVTKVHQKGYTLHGKVIRPARVAVSHYEQ